VPVQAPAPFVPGAAPQFPNKLESEGKAKLPGARKGQPYPQLPRGSGRNNIALAQRDSCLHCLYLTLSPRSRTFTCKSALLFDSKPSRGSRGLLLCLHWSHKSLAIVGSRLGTHSHLEGGSPAPFILGPYLRMSFPRRRHTLIGLLSVRTPGSTWSPIPTHSTHASVVCSLQGLSESEK
jgi:hypothetical protein